MGTRLADEERDVRVKVRTAKFMYWCRTPNISSLLYVAFWHMRLAPQQLVVENKRSVPKSSGGAVMRCFYFGKQLANNSAVISRIVFVIPLFLA